MMGRDIDYCPHCQGELDTGYECNKCGRDWMWLVLQADARAATTGLAEKQAAHEYTAGRPDFADRTIASLVRMAFIQGIRWERTHNTSDLIAALRLLVDSHTKTTDVWPCIVAAQAALAKVERRGP